VTHVEELLNDIAAESANRSEYSDQMIELLRGQLMIELQRGKTQESTSDDDKKWGKHE